MDKSPFPSSYSGYAGCSCNHTVVDKNQPFETFVHYSDPSSRQERTVFGAAKPGLFYNYSDRLIGDLWDAGCKKAAKKKLKPKTAAFFEVVLNTFHGSKDVNLQHVQLGCNRMSGYSYLIFGYTYTEPKQPKASPKKKA